MRVPVSIMSDRDLRFTSRFWPKLQKALGTTLHFNTAFHSQTNGQFERTIQTLKDMFWACVLEFKNSWVDHLSLVEFAYNNGYQASIGMAPYKALYGKKCRTSLCWDEIGEMKLNDVELIEITLEKIRIIWERLKVAQDKQKSYVDTRRRELEFDVGDMIFLKVAHWKWVIWFQKWGKFNPQYIDPFKILERIGSVAYWLELLRDLERIHDVFRVFMLRKYISDPSHVLKAPPIELKEDLSFEVQLIGIINQRMKELRNKVIPMVKVLWRRDTIEDKISIRG